MTFFDYVEKIKKESLKSYEGVVVVGFLEINKRDF